MPKSKHWRFAVDVEKLAWLSIDSAGSPVNVLGREAMGELETIVARLEDLIASGDVLGVILLSAKDNGFIAGADVREFDAMSDPSILPDALKRTHALFDRIENLKAPVVAGIHGFCLGGGLELALACHYRIAVNDEATKIGFPEIRLGIFPGFGGTGRSILRAGPVDAMTAMLTGRNYSGRAARAMGLVDKLVPHRDNLRWEARKAVLQKRTSRRAGFLKRLPAMGPLRAITARRMRAATTPKANPRHYPAPHRLIDCFEEHGNKPRAMMADELREFPPLMATPTAANLRRVFFLSEGLKSQGIKGKDKPVFRRVHVIGAGVMGGDIAAWCALRGMAVTLQDLDLARIKPALDRAKSLFRKRLKSKREVDAALSRLDADVDGRGVARADVVIEAIVERLEVKRSLFAGIEPRLKAGAILASNTSSIPLEEIATALKDPSRLVGLHFFNPVAQLPLVEVVRAKANSEEAIRMGCSFVLAIGKSPVVVRSAPGFLVNRVLMPYMLAAVERFEAGENPATLDAAAVEFGMPMGPIELMDVVGLDVGRLVAEELGHKVPSQSRFARLVESARLGRKTGEGFYAWKDGKPVKPRAPARDDLAKLGRELVEPLVDECERCLEAQIVSSADLVDIGVILGTGFAPFLGGPLKARADGEA